ncbi:hypothetical protein FGG08_001916 [Glutinoglossum americanum]|uniref:Uncharacterized protein n=1 Tax=Glutinoglossum americanum TaxID=1670608 RepID=A0A9P8IA43_9PEZI|nr:hypothetical protein FGG08_001916 [Glutinoglossum americanum]
MLRINFLAALLLFLSPFMAVLADPITTTTYTSTCTITRTVKQVVATAVVTGYPPRVNITSTSWPTYANSTTTINVAAPTQNVTSIPTLTPTVAPKSAASGHRVSLIATWLFGSVVALAGFAL